MRTCVIIALLVLGTGLSRAQSLVPTQPITCAEEQNCLARLGGIARRNGDALHLQLDNGRTKTLTSNVSACLRDDAENCLRMTLVLYRPSERIFVVKSWGYDDGTYDLISQRTGATTSLNGLPHFSPNGAFFALVGQDIMSNVFVEVWSLNGDLATRVLDYSAPMGRETWEFLDWNGNDRLRLRAAVTDINSTQKIWEIEALLTAQGWRLARPWAGQ